jgi:hypothetical protein
MAFRNSRNFLLCSFLPFWCGTRTYRSMRHGLCYGRYPTHRISYPLGCGAPRRRRPFSPPAETTHSDWRRELSSNGSRARGAMGFTHPAAGRAWAKISSANWVKRPLFSGVCGLALARVRSITATCHLLPVNNTKAFTTGWRCPANSEESPYWVWFIPVLSTTESQLDRHEPTGRYTCRLA